MLLKTFLSTPKDINLKCESNALTRECPWHTISSEAAIQHPSCNTFVKCTSIFFLPTKKSDPSCIWWFQKWGPLLVPKNGLQKSGYPLCLDKWSFLHYRNYTKLACQSFIAALQLRSLPCRDLEVSYWLHYMGCTTALLRASCGPCSCRDLYDTYWLFT